MNDIDRLKPLLIKAQHIPEPFKRRLYVLGIISHALGQEAPNLQPILVGGGAVEVTPPGMFDTLSYWDLPVGNTTA